MVSGISSRKPGNSFSHPKNTPHYIAESRIDMKNKYNEPSVLICFDEAQELFSDQTSARDMRFWALRRALRHQTCVEFSKDIKNPLMSIDGDCLVSCLTL